MISTILSKEEDIDKEQEKEYSKRKLKISLSLQDMFSLQAGSLVCVAMLEFFFVKGVMAEVVEDQIGTENDQTIAATSETSATSESMELTTPPTTAPDNNNENSSTTINEPNPSTTSPSRSAAAALFPPTPPSHESSPIQKNDPHKRRNSYKDVESRLYQSTAAVNNGKWHGPPPTSSPTSSKNHVKQPILTPSTSQNQDHNHVETTPNGTASVYKDVPSRLHEATAATSHGKWTKTSPEPEKTDLPKFSTAVRRASMGDLIISSEKDKSTWKDPYKDTVQSRLYSPTIATTQGQWKSTDDQSSEAPPSSPHSPGDKARRRFSTTFLTTDMSTLVQELPSSGKASPYDNVKSRLHLQTAAVKNSKWTGERPGEAHSPEPPRFISTFNKSASPAPPTTPTTPSEQYKDIKPRLYDTTAAVEHARYTGPEVSTDSSLPKFDTSVRRASLSVTDFNTPPPVPENHRYRNIQSRLHAPTTASKEGVWKKDADDRKSLSPETLTPPTSSAPPSRLLKPTVSSLHHVWGAPPASPPNTAQPQLIKSKAYENVGSRLLCPTASYLAKYTVVEDDGLPKEAFGHPIEPEYQNLQKKTPRLSSGGAHSPTSGVSRTSSHQSIHSPSHSSSTEPH